MTTSPLSYFVGYILSLVATLVPFALVLAHVHSAHTTFTHAGLEASIVASALVQLAVQFIFFLHPLRGEYRRWNLLAFALMLLFVGTVVIGSLWIMYNLNVRMTPNMTTGSMEAYMQSQDGM